MPVKKTVTKALQPKAVGDIVEKEEMEVAEATSDPLYKVRIGTRTFDRRTLQQTLCLVEGSAGIAKKITISEIPTKTDLPNR